MPTVDYIVKKVGSEGTICNNHCPGRARATTSSKDLNIVIIKKHNRRITAPEIAEQFNVGRDKPVSVTTVKRRLLVAGLKGCIASQNNFLNPLIKKKHLIRLQITKIGQQPVGIRSSGRWWQTN